jgi:hypothetical protein
LTVSRTPTSSSLAGGGGTVTHTVRVTNAWTGVDAQDANFDDITEAFGTPLGSAYVGTPGFVAGSATLSIYDGSDVLQSTQAMPSPVIVGRVWKWTDYYTVPEEGGYIELSYQVRYPIGAGTYQQRATAHVGTTQIDTTPVLAPGYLTDDAPAIATVTVGDTDGDDVSAEIDRDSDNDCITDSMESGLLVDPDGDADGDTVPNFRDPDFVACTDTTPADGVCDALPVSIDFDGDGIPNHLDLDSDADGITDAYEAESGDADGDGLPDDCAPVTVDGECNGGSVPSPPDTDAAGGADYLDPDSDGDGISDYDEAYDTDGDGAANLSKALVDTDGDGIDDSFDPSCALVGDCGGVIGQPVLAVLTSAQDILLIIFLKACQNKLYLIKIMLHPI